VVAEAGCSRQGVGVRLFYAPLVDPFLCKPLDVLVGVKVQIRQSTDHLPGISLKLRLLLQLTDFFRLYLTLAYRQGQTLQSREIPLTIVLGGVLSEKILAEENHLDAPIACVTSIPLGGICNRVGDYNSSSLCIICVWR
jgi:hypothetical protein